MLGSALNRTGGTITGNIVVNAGVTIDGVDISAFLNQATLTTSSPTFVALTLSGALTSTSSASFTGTLASGAITSSGVLTVNNVGPHVFTGGATNILRLTNTASGLTERAYVQVNAGTSAVYLQALSQAYLTAGDLVAAGGAVEATGAGGLSLSAVDAAGVLRFFTGGAAAANQRLAITALGHVNLLKYTETMTDVVISAGTLTLNLALGTHFRVSALNANITTLTISNPPPTGTAGSFTVLFTADGTVRTIAWPASVTWPNGTAPTMTGTNLKSDLITCLTYDGGAGWRCAVGGQNW